MLSRRTFLSVSAATLPLASVLGAASKKVPVGLELYSVRKALQSDLSGTVEAVAKMGYECVEFFSPYYEWTTEKAQEQRKQLDSLKVKCYSTHNGLKAFTPDSIQKTIDLNMALGSKYIVLAHPGKAPDSADGWKKIAETLNAADDKFASHKMHAGYHNHDLEWKPVEGQKPIEILAANTAKNVMLQLDVGTCLETGNDPVAWIEKNPGRIRSIHCKDWSQEKGYRVMFGEGSAPWKKIFAAAESKGGIEYYLIEQEGYSKGELETAAECLKTFRETHV